MIHGGTLDADLEGLSREQLMAEHELRPGSVCPNYVLADIARLMPKTPHDLAALPGLRRWQVDVFGARLLGSL